MLLLCIILSSFSSILAEERCPAECRCESRNRVYCNNRGFRAIPNGIPIDTKVLHLQDNSLENTLELDDALGQLVNLERVMLYNNRLTHVPKLQSNALRELRLNSNRINRIDGKIFEYVPNLTELILDENQLTNTGIDTSAFKGVNQLTRLSMMKNGFTEFPSLLPPSVMQLYLSQNQISFVSHSSLSYMTNLELLFLDRNKLSDGSFEVGSLGQLQKLVELELGYNFLTSIPDGIHSSLERLHLTANQIVYLRTRQLDSFTSLHTLDLAYNRLKSVEKHALRNLNNLMRVDLSGNNWNCDCYLLPLKQFLSSNMAHIGAREHVVCGDQPHLGLSLDQVEDESLKCSQTNFSLNKIGDGSSGTVSVKIDSGHIAETPPFVRYILQYHKLDNDNITTSCQLRLMEEKKITNLDVGSYRFCVFNAYFGDGSTIADKYCKVVDMEVPESIMATQSMVDDSTPAIRSSDEVAPLPHAVTNIELIVAVLCAAAGLVIMCLIVGGILWRKRRFLHLKNSSINRNQNLEETKLSYCSKLIATTMSSKPDLTLDASKEFAVTLMLRAPPQSDYQTVHPMSYPSHIGTSQTELYDVNCNNSSRNDTSLYI